MPAKYILVFLFFTLGFIQGLEASRNENTSSSAKRESFYNDELEPEHRAGDNSTEEVIFEDEEIVDRNETYSLDKHNNKLKETVDSKDGGLNDTKENGENSKFSSRFDLLNEEVCWSWKGQRGSCSSLSDCQSLSAKARRTSSTDILTVLSDYLESCSIRDFVCCPDESHAMPESSAEEHLCRGMRGRPGWCTNIDTCPELRAKVWYLTPDYVLDTLKPYMSCPLKTQVCCPAMSSEEDPFQSGLFTEHSQPATSSPKTSGYYPSTTEYTDYHGALFPNERETNRLDEKRKEEFLSKAVDRFLRLFYLMEEGRREIPSNNSSSAFDSGSSDFELKHVHRHLLPENSCGRCKDGQNRRLQPWTVLFHLEIASFYKPIKFHLCSGLLINKKYAITAAHCWDVHNGYQNKNYVARMGNHWSHSIPVEDIIIHPEYKHYKDQGVYTDDIALIRLKEEIKFNGDIQPICLPMNFMHGHDFKFESLTGVSWNDRASIAEIGNVHILPADKCSSSNSNMICGGASEGNCSEKNLLVKEDIKNKRWHAIALAATSQKECEKSSKSNASYLRIDKYLIWILDNLNSF